MSLLGDILQGAYDTASAPIALHARMKDAANKNKEMVADGYITENNDVFAHARAMAEQAQKGWLPGLGAQLLGLAKEFWWDTSRNLINGKGFAKTFSEGRKDLLSNILGGKIGRENPNIPLDKIPELNALKSETIKEWERDRPGYKY